MNINTTFMEKYNETVKEYQFKYIPFCLHEKEYYPQLQSTLYLSLATN